MSIAPGATTGQRVGAIATRQHGVVARRQLVAAGVRPSTIGDWARGGHIHRLHRGVYAVGSRAIGEDGRRLAAVLACGDGAALAAISAAEHLRLSRTRMSIPLHVAIRGRGKRNVPGVRVHRPRSLAATDVIEFRSVPVTSPTRTLFDIASTVSPAFLRTMYERAEYMEGLDGDRLGELLDGATGRRGLGELRALLDLPAIPLSQTRSSLERIVLSTCRAHGLPIPGVNVPVLDYEVDFHWPEARFVVEADGGQHVDERRDRDNERDVRLARAGILIRRYSEQALRNREAVGREIREILAERLRLFAGVDLVRDSG